MSRRSKSSTPIPVFTGAAPPPSHPLELQSLEHRSFLIRSLDRCDVEIAALVKLHQSLRRSKQAIIDDYGEGMLLDLGSGVIALNATADGLESKQFLDEDAEALCLDFLLRMKLRRRLLNRLSRRLNRVAHAMDGSTDFLPPQIPKYGDARLHIDEQAVAEFAEEHMAKEAARLRVLCRHQHGMEMPEMNPEEYVQKYTDDDIETQPHLPSSDREDDTKADHQSGNAGAKECQYDETAATEVKTPDAVVQAAPQPEQAAASEPPEAKPEQPTIADHLSPADPATVAAETPTDLEKPSAPPVAQSTASAPTSNQEASTGQEARQEEPDAPVFITGKNTAPPPPALTSGEEELTPADDNAHPEQSQSSYHVYDDYDLLKDYKDAYEQILDVTTGQTRFAILEQPPPPIITGVGIGGRSMAPQEKELEYKRWQTALLTKIPEQPTASELGMASRVFGLEDRRKRIQEELEEEQRNKKLKRSPVKVENEDDDRDTYEEKDDDEDDKEYKDGDDDVEVGKKNGNGHRDDDEMKEEKDDDRPKRVKAMSLIPVPSFYDQDLYRVRLVHADLLATSIHEHARRRISEATNDYNRAFRVSNELYNQRVKLQNDVAMIDHQQRLFLTKFKNDYAVQVTLARARWQKSKEEWEHNQAHKTMQGMFGQMPVGTNKTQAAARHPNQVVNTVGLTLGRVVDAVVLKLEGGSGREQFEEFVPPHAPDFDAIVVDKETGETYGQRNQRIQASAHQQLQTLNMQLQQSEEERKRAWRKLCKTKAEYELPTSGRRRVDPDLAAQTPVPPLRASSAVPSAASFQPTSMATYVPQSKPKYQLSNPSESKYSAARVRERISSDGTVAPVTAPKRDKDGLYMRPAGRTRKGMNWDAIRGIWVPAPMR